MKTVTPSSNKDFGLGRNPSSMVLQSPAGTSNPAGVSASKTRIPSFELAFKKALKRLQEDDSIYAIEHDAGLINLEGEKGKRTGLQVFVKIARFNQELLNRFPVTGGLLENIDRITKKP